MYLNLINIKALNPVMYHMARAILYATVHETVRSHTINEWINVKAGWS